MGPSSAAETLSQFVAYVKKIAVSDNEWEEIEIAVQKLKIFERAIVPQLTHGLCKFCYQFALSEIERLRQETNN